LFVRFNAIAAGVLLTPIILHAAPGREGAAFLDIPIGGAPSAMGSAYSALATDAYAPVLNPAGLGFVESTQFAGHHISYLETSSYDFASLVHPLKAGRSFGASLQYLGTGDITRRDTTGAATGDFSSHYSAASFGYGQTLTEKLSLGVTGRWINGKIDNVSANSYAGDIGALYRSKNAQTSLVVANIGNSLKFLNSPDPVPLALHVGEAQFFPHGWTVSAEGVYENTGLLSGRFGSQWQVIPMMALRAGYRTDTLKELSALAGFSTGVGLSMWNTEIAYTWLPYGELGQTHSFSLLWSFGKSARSRNMIKYSTYHRHNPQADEKNALEYDDLSSLLDLEASPRMALGEEHQP
jgi:hypothetical protein